MKIRMMPSTWISFQVLYITMLTVLATLFALAIASPTVFGLEDHTPSLWDHGPWGGSYGHGSKLLPTSSAPTVTVKNGTIAGLHSATYNEDFFLGVPFAEPPVGSLRFRNPQSINTTFSGTYEATEYAPSCVGYGG